MNRRTAALAAFAAIACRGATPAPTPAPAPSTAGKPLPAANRGGGATATRADSTARSGTPVVPERDLTKQAVEIFGDSIAKVPASADTAPGKGEPTWDIDVRSYETHSRVEFHIDRFTGGARATFMSWLTRGGRYEPMIRPKLRAAGLPEDLTYLAMIESGYNPHAYSRAAAVGMWQFMTTTARGTGLRVDWWVDERRDPVKSTDAAVKFLGWLKEQFGSLYLAAAAYNGGPGRIGRGLTRYADDLAGTEGEDVFFALAEQNYLRAETKDYVPKLIAAALVAKAPERYGLQVSYLPPLVYDTVPVGPSTPLAVVGAAAGATTAEMRDLNPAILRGVSPPGGPYQLYVPAGRGDSARLRLAAMPDSELRAFSRIQTRKGEKMTALATRSGVSARILGWYNRGLKPGRGGRLAGGITVLVPKPSVVAAALDVPDPAVERYGSARRGTVTHVVKRGESLGLLARRYRTSVATLRRLNGLRKNLIIPGQVIVVKGRAATPARRPRTTTARSSARRPASSSSANGSRVVHVVRRGESLTAIARRYDTTTKVLKQRNGLRGSDIQIGQRLVVR